MGITEIVALTLSVIDKVMDKLPNYSQVKRQQFYRLRTKYETEQVKDFPERDDNLVELSRRELIRFIETFAEDLK